MTTPPPAPKRRIAILGGGCGGMAAAWGLMNSEAADTLDVTIYQLGWRLGGKGASGRNQKIANRIEEHGLHIWGGMYENAFAIMRSAVRRPRLSERPEGARARKRGHVDGQQYRLALSRCGVHGNLPGQLVELALEL